jgi:ribosomal protein S18 acetylase RimI-like enzyme
MRTRTLQAPALAGWMGTLCRLEPSDIQTMLDLFRRGTPPAELSRSIYSAPGADKFLRRFAQDPARHRDEQFWGLKDEAGRLLGAAHTRDLAESSHLNQIAVDPSLQGRGLGSWMLAHWGSLALARGASWQTLDVAESNVAAHRLYLRHGFAVAGQTREYRYRGEVPAAGGSEVPLAQWPEAQASFKEYGFGRFRLELDGKWFQVDLARDFRIPDPDSRILSFLARLDPERGILLRTALADPEGEWEATGSLFRMRKETLGTQGIPAPGSPGEACPAV